MTQASHSILLISVGGTPKPIVYSINYHKPDKIIFFVSLESRTQVNKPILPELDKQLGTIPDHEYVVTNNEVDVGESTFTLLREVPRALKKMNIEDKQWPDVVDYTGGTKSMSAAVVWASSRYPCRFSYVGPMSPDARTKSGLGIVIDGKEYCFVQENPWDSVAFFEIRSAMGLFGRGQYANAAGQIEAVLSRVTEPRTQRLLKVLADIFRGFHYWDIFDHKQARYFLDKSVRPLQDITPSQPVPVAGLEHFAAEVERLCVCLNTIRPAELTIEMIRDLLANAWRRAVLEKNYEDATARCYAAIEKYAQYVLQNEYGINSSDALPEKLPAEIREEYVRKYKNMKRQRDGTFKPKIQFGVIPSLEILKITGHSVGKRYAEREETIRSHMNERNESILAHGIVPMNEKKFRAIFDDALYLLDMKENEMIRFPEFTSKD